MSCGYSGNTSETRDRFRFEIYSDPSDASRVLVKHPDGTFRSERPEAGPSKDGVYVGCTFISKAALERIRSVPECK